MKRNESINIANRDSISAAEYRQMTNADKLPSKRIKSKFGAVKCEIDGIKFDSKKEVKRFTELQLLHKVGKITKPVLQYEFLLPGSIIYRCDFLYYCLENLKFVVEDTKGFKTKEYILKKKLMKECLGIIIYES
jgi:Protein of unknown function (DUF1064)